MYEAYLAQARLLLKTLPLIKKYPHFSLKGGTALNFFINDFPRLSVDIDLAYTQIDGREVALGYITRSMEDLTLQVERLFRGSQVQQKRTNGGFIRGLVIQTSEAVIKVEPNLIVRGTVFAGENRSLSPRVKELFRADLKFPVLSIPDLYGGKICAALDRQHPRDLFDIRLMFRTVGLTDKIKNAFLVYLISHPRPISEVLNPNLLDLSKSFEQEFMAMTNEAITLDDLESTRVKLISRLHAALTPQDREFLLSMKSDEPKWDLFPLDHIKGLPAVNWKLINIQKMSRINRMQARKKLERVLQEGPTF
jgi:hypothetical protein